MKKFSFSRVTNIILWAVVAFALYQKVPGWIANYEVEGKKVESFPVVDENGESLSLPVAGKKQVVIFWATWCGPCTVELSRFNAAVKKGELQPADVIAVSLGEEPSLVFREAKTRDYGFTVRADPEGLSARSLEVQGTPQTFHINAEGKVVHASVGLSLFPVWRASMFLKN